MTMEDRKSFDACLRDLLGKPFMFLPSSRTPKVIRDPAHPSGLFAPLTLRDAFEGIQRIMRFCPELH